MSIKLYDKSGSTPQEVLLAGISPVDQILNGTSKNAISNKAVYNALAEKIEVTVENLTNFYNKSQTYNKTEVRALVDAISTMTIEVVNSLPTQDISTTTIYFLKQSGTNVYDQYVYVNNAWVKIGDTQIDLSGYMTTADFNIAIADYYDKSAIDTMIANYYTKAQVDDLLQNVEIDVDSALSNSSENPVQNKVIKAALDGKQGLVFTGTQAEWDALSVAQKTSYTFCNITDDTDYVGNIVDAITDGNMSAVTSNAVYDYPFDSIEDGQHRPPTSNAVFDALAPLRQNTNGYFVLPNGLKICWGGVGGYASGTTSGHRITNYPITFTSKPRVFFSTLQNQSSSETFIYDSIYDYASSSTTQLKSFHHWTVRADTSSRGWSQDDYSYIAIGY